MNISFKVICTHDSVFCLLRILIFTMRLFCRVCCIYQLWLTICLAHWLKLGVKFFQLSDWCNFMIQSKVDYYLHQIHKKKCALIKVLWEIMEVVIKGGMLKCNVVFLHLYYISKSSLRGSVGMCNDDLCGIIVNNSNIIKYSYPTCITLLNLLFTIYYI